MNVMQSYQAHDSFLGGVQVWFKHDLRLDDHPGLTAALEAGDPIIPFFCFDPAMYAHLVRLPCGVEGAHHFLYSR